VFGLGLVVPIRKGREIIGVLKCNLNILGSISELISGENHQLLGKLKLVRSGGMVVFEEGFEPLSAKIHRSIFEKLKSKKSGTFIIDDVGEKYIVGCSEIELTKGGEGYGFGGTFESIDHKKGNTGESWYVICSRQMSAALTPFTKSIKTIILISTAIILILVFVAYLFGRKIANPLSVINKATEKIGKGDFEYRIGVMGKDEFGNLGNSFNSMASKLQQTTTSIVELEHEITERKQAEKALRESEERYRTLVVNLPVAVYRNTPGPKGAFLMANPAFCKMFGFNNEEEVLDFTPANLYQNPKKRKEYSDNLIRKGVIKNDEWTLLKRDGTSVYTSITSRVVHGQDGEVSHFDSIMLDITDQKKLESQLQQSQKMEAVGILAGGIAHDYNNLLAVIMGNLSMAQEEAEPHSAMAELLYEIEQASYKARDLTHQFLTLSEGGHPRKELGTMESLLKEIPKQVQANENLEYIISIQDDLWFVEYDSKQIQDAVTNVLKNAVEAMPHGGAITVQAENRIIDNKVKDPALPLNEGRYVRISIKDEGPGISEEHMDKVFDPYFSTKERGVQKGMGLGLTTAYAVVQKHGGHIMLNSTTGVGTTVTIYLPAMGSAECGMRNADYGPAPDERESKQSTIKRILVMDDEEMLRNLAQKMLERLGGYKVATVKDGVEAIETYKKQMDSGEPFDGVILDLTIKGGMGGEQTIRELSKIDPGVKAIVCSGYFNDPVITNFEEYGFRGAMAKPYQKADLESVLKKVLG
jgi:PAS domain S-box-containing protein